jgi:hypothetical protein
MSVAAHLSGHSDESRFWTDLPATLAHIKTLQDAIQQRQQQQQEQQQLSRRASAIPPSAVGGSSLSDLAGTGTPGATAAAAAAGADSAGVDAAAEAAAAAAVDEDADVADASDYDFMVQQALEGSLPAANTAQTSEASSPAAAAAAGSSSHSLGSGSVVPGRVLYSGSQQQQFSRQGTIRRVAQGTTV